MLDDEVTQFLLLVCEGLQPGGLMWSEVGLGAPPDLIAAALEAREHVEVPLLGQLLTASLQRV